MLQVLKTLNTGFNDFLDKGDSRLKDWPLMKNPFASWVMIVAYVYFVKVAGPKWMKNRKPFDLRNLMAVYNFAMVIANGYVFYTIGRYGYFDGYGVCEPVDYSLNYKAVKMLQAGYILYILKFVEFADTVFFVLRKKNNQISALHVVHHSIVPFSLWFGVKFASGGYNAFFPFLNTFVHILMYSYYGLAAFGPKVQKFLIWKKFLTQMQMGQFILVMGYVVLMLVKRCHVPEAFIFANASHAALFLVLFLNFYRKSYTPKTNKGKSKLSMLTENGKPIEVVDKKYQ